jgi:hypothetical protein
MFMPRSERPLPAGAAGSGRSNGASGASLVVADGRLPTLTHEADVEGTKAPQGQEIGGTKGHSGALINRFPLNRRATHRPAESREGARVRWCIRST